MRKVYKVLVDEAVEVTTAALTATKPPSFKWSSRVNRYYPPSLSPESPKNKHGVSVCGCVCVWMSVWECVSYTPTSLMRLPPAFTISADWARTLRRRSRPRTPPPPPPPPLLPQAECYPSSFKLHPPFLSFVRLFFFLNKPVNWKQ